MTLRRFLSKLSKKALSWALCLFIFAGLWAICLLLFNLLGDRLSLSTMLFLGLFLSAGFAVLTHFYYSLYQGSGKLPVIVYALLICVLCSATVYHLIGVARFRNPSIALEKQLLFKHVGYYTALGQKFIFSDRKGTDELYHPALGANESVVLDPTTLGRDGQWRIQYNVRTYPLRINGKIVNIPEQWWLNSGDSLSVRRRDGNQTSFFKLNLQIDPATLFKDVKNTYGYSQGSINAQGQETYQCKDVELYRRVLQEGYRLSVIAGNSTSKEFQSCIEGSNWWSTFEKIILVREQWDDKSSRIGVFLDQEILENPEIEIYKNNERLSALSEQMSPLLPLAVGAAVEYGFDKRKLSLILPGQFVDDPSWGKVIDVQLNPAPSWPLPPDSSAAFIVTSSKDYIPLDGYFIDMGEGSPSLNTSDILDWPGFYTHLSRESETNAPSPGKRIFDLLPENVRQRTQEVVRNHDFQNAPKAGLVMALNNILGRRDFYQKEEFQKVELPDEARQLLTRNSADLSSKEVERLNRLLLEASYPREIIKTQSDPSPPFYAKALFNSGKAQREDSQEPVLTVNGGGIRIKRPDHNYGEFKFDESIRLGESRKGVTLALGERRAAFDYPGRWAAGILLAVFLLFALMVFLWPNSKWRSYTPIAWAGIWGTTILILTARFVLAYRASLFPPEDATLKQLRNVFHKGLEQSRLALFLVPAILAVLPVMASWLGPLLQRIPGPLSRLRINQQLAVFRIVCFLLLLLLLSIWLVTGWAIGKESIQSVRLNLVAHVLIIAGLIFISRYLVDKNSSSRRVAILAASGLIVLTTAAMLLGIGDLGFLIYCLSYLIFFVSTFAWFKISWSAGLLWGGLICLGFGGIFFLLPKMPFVQKVIYPSLPERAYFRLVSQTGTEEEILFQRSAERNLDVDRLMNNSQQNWQMLLYAAEGGDSGNGLGQVPLSKVAMTYPTSMADCVFSTYVLSEHGRNTGLWLLLNYVALAGFCFYGGYYLPDKYQHRLLPMIAIGAFFACNALYVASANTGLLVFTGQNIPFLSLYSETDWVQGALLLGLVLWLLYFFQNGVNVSSLSLNSSRPALFTFTLVVLAGLVGWAGFAYLHMGTLSADIANRDKNPYLKNHNFSEKFYERIESRLPSIDTPGFNTALKLEAMQGDPGNYKIVPALGSNGLNSEVNEIEERYIDRFNKEPKAKKYDANAGLYHLENVDLPGKDRTVAVKVNRNYLKILSPFAKESLWHGMIMPRDASALPTFIALGSSFAISLSGEGFARTISLETTPPPLTNRTVNIISGGYTFCTLERDPVDPNSVLLQAKQPERAGDWSLYIDGELVNKSRKLERSNMVVIEQGDHRWNFMYLGAQGPVFAHVQWRNGRDQRLYPLGDVLPLSYSIGKAGDQLETATQKLPSKLELTLDLDLEKRLQETVENYAHSHPQYAEGFPLSTNKLAVTVMDAFNGEILALPSWPKKNPADQDFEEMLQSATSTEESRLLNNYNLTRHSVGSTVKPLVFSSLATQFWPDKDVSQIIAYNRANKEEGGAHWHTKLGGLCIAPWDCNSATSPIDSDNFIIHSLDFYEGELGMLGMLFDPNDWSRALQPTNGTPDIQYGNQKLTFDLRGVTSSNTPFTLADECPRLLTDAMNRPLLFKGLKESFGVEISTGSQEERFNTQSASCQQVFPSFCKQQQWSADKYYLDNILPDPVIFVPRSWQTIRGDVISFVLGGGPGRWNNIKMAEAGTVLANGRRAAAHLERINPAPQSSIAPAPLNDDKWRSNHLISPMMRVAAVGTAANLKDQVPLPYRIMCKTGTIEERDNGRESEFLLFVIGKWENNRFVEGHTVACFFYLEDSKLNPGPEEKMVFAKPIVAQIAKYLQEHDKPQEREKSKEREKSNASK